MAVTLRFDEQAMQTVQEAFADERYWQANEATSERETLEGMEQFIRPFPGYKSWPHTIFADRAWALIAALGRYRDALVAAGDLETAAHVSDLGRQLQNDYLAEGGPAQLEKLQRRSAHDELLELAA